MPSAAKERLLVVTRIPPDLRAALAETCQLVEYEGRAEARAAAPPRAPGFRIAVTTSMAGADEALMEALPDLRFLACNGAGLENIDMAAAAKRGIEVCNTPDVLTEDTADFAIALTYAVARRVAEADRFVRAGRWPSERMAPSRRLKGKVAGIVGLGKIGSAVAWRAEGIGMRVVYTQPHPRDGAPYPFVPDLGALAEAADVLILTCPGGESTRGLIGAEVLRKLGSEGYLINISRGTVVDQEALIEALSQGTIAGAGLDVYAAEPNIDQRFIALDNVVLQPHYASVTQETRAAMVDLLATGIARYLATASSGPTEERD